MRQKMVVAMLFLSLVVSLLLLQRTPVQAYSFSRNTNIYGYARYYPGGPLYQRADIVQVYQWNGSKWLGPVNPAVRFDGRWYINGVAYNKYYFDPSMEERFGDRLCQPNFSGNLGS